MVRWIAGINPESFVVVEAEVQRPIEPVKRCRVSNFELRITRCYLLAPAPAILGMTLAAANRPVVDFNDEAIGAPSRKYACAFGQYRHAQTSSGFNRPLR